jgi:hypothetical protein
MVGQAMQIDDRDEDLLPGVVAHWLLGRMAVARAAIAHVRGNDTIDPSVRDLLLERSAAAVEEAAIALQDLVRGIPPVLTMLRSSVTDIAVIEDEESE